MKNCRALGFVLLLSMSSLSLAQTITRPPQPASSRLSRILDRIKVRLNFSMPAARFPGAQVGFVYVDGETADGKPRYVSGSIAVGVSDLETKTPLKTTDRFLAGSIGKTFVSALTLMLVQEGKLKLDERIQTWLGNEPWFSQLPNASDITLRMLLNHSSGIENHVETSSFQKQLLKSGARNVKYDELIAYVLRKKPLFPAGQGYKYSDTNYILVGMIIEKVTGKTLYDLIDERILKPCKLGRTIPSNSSTLPEVANGYLGDGPVIVDGRFRINPQWEWAGGGFASTTEDLARWGHMLYDGEVLSPDSLEQMINGTSTGEGSVYGLGVMITRSNFGRSYGHDGEFPGYLSDLRYYQKYKITIAVMVNSDETPGVDRFMTSAADDFAQIIIRETSSREVSQADQIKLKALAENWLTMVHSDNLDEAWNQVSERMSARFTKESWIALMRRFLDQSGRFKSRKFVSISYGDPDTERVIILYDSSFSKKPDASESLVLEKQNNEWRVSSYSIR